MDKRQHTVAWWDYGRTIRESAERETVIFSPSKEIMWSVASKSWNESASGALSKNRDVKNVATILTTPDPEEALELMASYNASYVLCVHDYYGISSVLYNISGIPNEEPLLIDYPGTELQLQQEFMLNRGSLFHRMLQHEEILGFELVYSDAMGNVIYRMR